MSLRITQDGPDVLLGIKVVAGASGDGIAGVLGDRLKVRVSAPPEGGKANRGVERLLEELLDARGRVEVESGHATVQKTVGDTLILTCGAINEISIVHTLTSH